MMGPKTLREIREELQRGFAAEGEDPIEWLERIMNDPQYQGPSGKSEVLESLRRFLERTDKVKKPRTRRSGTKKKSPRG